MQNFIFSKRSFLFAALLCGLIALGLGSRAYTGSLSGWVHLYVGDVLYAVMYYALIRWLWPGKTPAQAVWVSLGVCVAIELLQLYHAPWLEGIRQTRLGGLVLGFGFLWSDVWCYAIGVVLARWVIVEPLVQRSKL